MVGLYIICAVIVLIINYIIAQKFSDIAEMKGHEGSTYFWFTFIFGLIGMLMVIALPNEKTVTVQNKPIESSSPESTIVSQKELFTHGEKTAHSWNDNCGEMTSKSPCEPYGDTSTPYWCGKCGNAGPYDGKCPKCNSSLKRYNNTN